MALAGAGPDVLGPVRPLLEGEGGIEDPHVEPVGDLGLLVGDLSLSGLEDELSQQWPHCLDGRRRAFRVVAAFHEVLSRASAAREADLVLIDVGPNLGSINRSALIGADHVVIPLVPDLYSIIGLQNLGPRLREWGKEWKERLERSPEGLDLPKGLMGPVGYVVTQHAVRLDRPVKAYARWTARIPSAYRESVLQEGPVDFAVEEDPCCLALLKHYRSLMPLAMEARKPMFHLKPADGAIGGHTASVQDCHRDFLLLALRIARQTGVPV